MTWGNVALILAVVWGAAMTVLLWVMVGAMREWKARSRERDKDLARALSLVDEYKNVVYDAMGEHGKICADVNRINNELVDLASLCRATERAVGGHTHPTKTDPEVQRLRGEVDKLSERLRMAEDLDATLGQQISAVAASIPHVPEPVDVVGVLQAALAPWTRKDPPAEQPSTQRTAGEDDTPTADPSLIFDPTYDEYPEPVQVTDAVGLPVIPGLPIDIPVANWGLPG